jgi:desulfoferrodoxin (superoxide reductase-like protein)
MVFGGTIGAFIIWFAIIWFAIASTFFGACSQERDQGKGDGGPRKPQQEYTRQRPGEWEGLKKRHLPHITVYPGKSKNNIKVRVNLYSESKDHYIERIGVMDGNKRDLVSKKIPTQTLQRVVKVDFTLDPIPRGDDIKVYVKCNRHDLWTAPLSGAERVPSSY